jgi:hypothetical protein
MSSGWPGFFFLNHPSRIPPHSIHTAGDLRNLAPRLGSTLRDRKVPRDGMHRYIYDIWQPLTLLVIMVFFTYYNPYLSMLSIDKWFLCNADGTLVKVHYDYRPF